MVRWARGNKFPGSRCHSEADSQLPSIRPGERLAETAAAPSLGTVGHTPSKNRTLGSPSSRARFKRLKPSAGENFLKATSPGFQMPASPATVWNPLTSFGGLLASLHAKKEVTRVTSRLHHARLEVSPIRKKREALPGIKLVPSIGHLTGEFAPPNEIAKPFVREGCRGAFQL
jgi:hypothetical protein